MKRILMALFFVLGLITAAHASGGFWLIWPLKCTVGSDCYVQNYVDHDPSTGFQDYTCGSQTYDGHNGTDIRLATYDALRRGVEVVAPADGMVIGVRKDMDDAPGAASDESKQEGLLPADVAGHECGNGVHIRHRAGWRTQLCHMRKDSITVKPGDRVKAGQVLGLVGMSGNTEFPHVHITVWKDNKVIDPFTREDASQACNSHAGAKETFGQWTTKVKYSPVTLLGSGFLTSVPDKDKMRDKAESLTSVPMNASAITFWADLAGIRAGDTVKLSIMGPDGHVFAENEERMTRNLAQFFVYIGKHNKLPMLPGNYIAQITIVREGSQSPILQSSRTVAVVRDGASPAASSSPPAIPALPSAPSPSAAH